MWGLYRIGGDKRVRLFLTLVVVFTTAGIFGQQRIVGYYPHWLRDRLPPEDLKGDLLSHVVLAFAWPESDGSIQMFEGLLDTTLSNTVHAKGMQLLLAMGGWGLSDGFTSMAASSSARQTFINNLLVLCDLYDLDGIDLDWEHPANATDRANLTLLVQEMYTVFQQVEPPLLLTMAVASSDWFGQWVDYEILQNYVDWFSMMGYDFHGGWTSHAGHNAPLYPSPPGDPEGACDTGINYLLTTRGIPQNKLNLGVPFYGREFMATDINGPSTGGDTFHYFDAIGDSLTNGWEYHWDDLAQVPYAQNAAHTKLITFDDTTSLSIKAQYVLDRQLGGVMIWALGQDGIGNNQPLLTALGSSYLPVVNGDETKTGSFSLVLYPAYPNPFNAVTTITYKLPAASKVELSIFTLQGEKVVTLVSEADNAGWHQITWEGKDSGGQPLPSGVYFYSITGGTSGFSQSRKLLLLK
jgi:chitinase